MPNEETKVTAHNPKGSNQHKKIAKPKERLRRKPELIKLIGEVGHSLWVNKNESKRLAAELAKLHEELFNRK